MKSFLDFRILAVAASLFFAAHSLADEGWTDEISLFHPAPAEGATNDTATTDQEQRRRGFGRFGGRIEGVYRTQITPNWFANNSHFWYRNDLRGGEREFMVVDAER